MDAAVLKKVAPGSVRPGTDKHSAYVLRWTFVRTRPERLRETHEKIQGFFAISRF
jgi:hypothetical protein